MTIGNWIILDTLYDNNGTRILQTSYSKWVLKVNTHTKQAAYELRVILDLFFAKVRHSVMLYPQLEDLYGNGWYALRRYDGHVDTCPWYRSQWRTIGIHVLRFLQDFHHELGLVHMDIKKGNIFCDQNDGKFVVGDYENSTTPCPETTIADYSNDHKWYYFSMGAEMDSPLMSWRFDLVALGYLLASLTVKSDKWTFENECWERRTGCELVSERPVEEVFALRARELSAADPVITEYMKRVETIPWDSRDPPSRSFYEELESVLVSA